MSDSEKKYKPATELNHAELVELYEELRSKYYKRAQTTHKKWRDENKLRRREYQRQYRLKNLEKWRAYERQYREKTRQAKETRDE